jgi:hypothetical protein
MGGLCVVMSVGLFGMLLVRTPRRSIAAEAL